MPHIRTIPPEQATGELKEYYDAAQQPGHLQRHRHQDHRQQQRERHVAEQVEDRLELGRGEVPYLFSVIEGLPLLLATASVLLYYGSSQLQQRQQTAG